MKKKKRITMIKAIDTAFKGMEERNENLLTIRTFEKINRITLPSGSILGAYGVQVDLIRDSKKNIIRITYRPTASESIVFDNNNKKIVIECLKKSRALPTASEFLEAGTKMEAETQKNASFKGFNIKTT